MATRRPFMLLCAATLAEFTAMGLFLAAIPLYVTTDLGETRTAAGISVGVFSVSAVLLRPAIGRGIDRHGRKPYLVGSLLLLAASSPLLVLARSVLAVVGVRLLQGVVGAAFYTTSATVATDLSPPERRASTIARFSLFLYGGFAAGPALGEWLIDTSGFAAAWWCAAALGVVGLAIVSRLPETGSREPRPALSLDAPSRRRIIHPAALAPGVVLACSAVGYSSVTAFSSIYARHVGMSSSGILYLTFASTIIVVRLASLRVVDRLGRGSVTVTGLVLATFGLLLLAAFEEPGTAIAGVGVFGAGFALVFPALMAFTVDRVPDHERGETLGSFTAFMDVGTGVGGFLVGRIADTWGFGWAYAVPAALCGAAAALFAAVAASSATGRVVRQ